MKRSGMNQSETECIGVDRVVMRSANSEKERLIAALNSKDEDLFEHNGRIVVWGKNLDDENIYLGDVCLDCFLQKGAAGRLMIERVRFGA